MVNDTSFYRAGQMPYGGVKRSGMGREGPRYAIEEMTELREEAGTYMRVQPQKWQAVCNLVPLPYRRVSVQPYHGQMTVDTIITLLLSREAYRRTDFIVLRGEGGQHAVAAITRAESEPLFSPITSVDVLALPQTCVFAECPDVDPANRSALAEVAHELGVGPEGTLVVKGLVRPHQLHSPPKASGRGGGGGCATRTAKIVRAGAAGPELCRPSPDSSGIGAHRSARAGRERTPIGLSGSLPLRWIGR